MLVIICTWKNQRMGTSNLMLMLISWTWGCTTFHNFISMFKKKIKSWQVCDWLAKWLIMSRYMDLRQPRVYRRSNVGLFQIWSSNLLHLKLLASSESIIVYFSSLVLNLYHIRSIYMYEDFRCRFYSALSQWPVMGGCYMPEFFPDVPLPTYLT